jgi:hypothetical protein
LTACLDRLRMVGGRDPGREWTVTFTPAAPCLTSDIRHPTQIICLHAALDNDPAVALKAATHALGVQPWGTGGQPVTAGDQPTAEPGPPHHEHCR